MTKTVAEIREMSAEEFEAYRQTVAAAERRTGLANVARCDRNRWCECADTGDATSYYEALSGYHGWFHDPAKGGCGGITQTG